MHRNETIIHFYPPLCRQQSGHVEKPVTKQETNLAWSCAILNDKVLCYWTVKGLSVKNDMASWQQPTSTCLFLIF